MRSTFVQFGLVRCWGSPSKRSRACSQQAGTVHSVRGEHNATTEIQQRCVFLGPHAWNSLAVVAAFPDRQRQRSLAQIWSKPTLLLQHPCCPASFCRRCRSSCPSSFSAPQTAKAKKRPSTRKDNATALLGSLGCKSKEGVASSVLETLVCFPQSDCALIKWDTFLPNQYKHPGCSRVTRAQH